MFNLIVGYNDPWPGNKLTMDMGRLFEFTDESVRDKFKKSDGTPKIDALTAFPMLLMREGRKDEPAFAGSITKVQKSGRDYVITFTIDQEMPVFRNRDLFGVRHNLEMEEWEFSRNHWAIKEADLFRALLPIASPTRSIPSFFKVDVPEVINPDLVAVMMPFTSDYNAVYKAIKLSAQNVGLETKRADDIWHAPQIMQDIVSLIDHAAIVVCDCTGKNPNVFYEAGIAHAFGREVVLISQSIDDIPFDLRHIRTQKYLNNEEGRAELVEKLQARFATIKQQHRG